MVAHTIDTGGNGTGNTKPEVRSHNINSYTQKNKIHVRGSYRGGIIATVVRNP